MFRVTLEWAQSLNKHATASKAVYTAVWYCRLLPVVGSSPWPHLRTHVPINGAFEFHIPPFDALLPALNLQQYNVPPEQATRLDFVAAQQVYIDSLTAAQSIIQHVWEPDTVRRREKTMQELSSWLNQLPVAWGRTLLTCSPADILAFMQGFWLQHHQGSHLPDGSSLASPSGVNQ